MQITRRHVVVPEAGRDVHHLFRSAAELIEHVFERSQARLVGHLHPWLALLLFLTFLGHMAASLHHGLIRRDGVLSGMTIRGRQLSAGNGAG